MENGIKQFFLMVFVLAIGAIGGWLAHDYYDAHYNRNRQCIELERKIKYNYEYKRRGRLIPNALSEKMDNLRMYDELARHGCSGNRAGYTARSGEIARELSAMGYGGDSSVRSPFGRGADIAVAVSGDGVITGGAGGGNAGYGNSGDGKITTASGNVNAEIKIDVDKVADAVNEAMQPAVEAMGKFFDKVKDTKVSITVE